MVGIKGMKKQTDCKKCPLMGTDGDPRDILSPMMCIAIWATTHEKKHCIGGKVRDDCPLVEIEERKGEHEKLERIEKIVKQVESLHPEIAIGDREGIRLIREVLNG